MKDKYDVVVVGAGPAGLSCAEVLAKGGKSVLVLEKNNEVGLKICAGGLTAKVEEENLVSLQDVDRIFYSIKLYFSKTCRKFTDSNPLVATINRGKLGKIMLEKAVRSGAEIEMGIEVKEISENSIIVKGQEIKYSYLIGENQQNLLRNKSLFANKSLGSYRCSGWQIKARKSYNLTLTLTLTLTKNYGQEKIIKTAEKRGERKRDNQ